MATTLTINNVKASIDWTYSQTVAGSINTANSNGFSYASGQMANGTGATTTADLMYALQTAIAASGNLVVDVAGSATDFFGNTMTMVRVKWIYVHLTTDTTGSSVAVGNATNPIVNWISASTATVKVLNGGVLLIGAPGATGYAVTATTGDQLKVLNNDGSNVATVNVCIIGSSA